MIRDKYLHIVDVYQPKFPLVCTLFLIFLVSCSNLFKHLTVDIWVPDTVNELEALDPITTCVT